MLKVLLADTDTLRAEAADELSAYRREKLRLQKNEQVRRCSLSAELLLIRAICQQDPDTALPLKIETDANGKPYLTDSRFFFNLSHSDPFSACALADFEIGLDIQTIAPCRKNLVKRFFAPEEQQAVFSSKDADGAFTRLWCRKESFLKAIGLGLRLELSSFSLAGEQPRISCGGKEYAFLEERVGELFLCLCAERDRLPESFPLELVSLS